MVTEKQIEQSRKLFKRAYGENAKAEYLVGLATLNDKPGIGHVFRKCKKCKGNVEIFKVNPKDMLQKRPKYICNLCLIKSIDLGEHDFPPEMEKIIRGTLK